MGVRGQCIRYAPTKCRRAVLWPFPYRAARSRRHFLAPPQFFISCLYCGGAAHGAAHDEPRNGTATGRTGGRGTVPKIYLYRGVTGAGARPPSSTKKFCLCTWTGGASPVQPVQGSHAGRLQGERRPINFFVLLFSYGKVVHISGVVRNVTPCQMFQLGVTIFENHLTLCQIKCILYNIRGNYATVKQTGTT